MSTKKICSIGNLSININIILTKEQSEEIDLDLDSYNDIEDLKSLLYPNNSNKINQKISNLISLSSDNNLLNTLLYINRVYNIKTFIEYIMPNQLEFHDKRKFIYSFIKETLNKNYIFIVENKIIDIPSKIKLIIKIMKNDNEIEKQIFFELFEGNDMDVEQINLNEEDEDDNNTKEKQINFFNKIDYNFSKTNFLLIDIKEIKHILLSSVNNSLEILFQNISEFLIEIINNYENLKIILIIDENFNNNNKNLINIYKNILNSSDIIFSFKNNLNKFLQTYFNNSSKNRLYLQNNNFFYTKSKNLQNFDLISKDFEKIRNEIPRHVVIFEEFFYVHIYHQEIKNKKNVYDETFILDFIQENEQKNKLNEMNKRNFIYNNANKLYHIFIGGYLPRYIYGKNYDICFKAANLTLQKIFKLLYENKDDIINKDNLTINIPIDKEYLNRKKVENLINKEKNFVLDCINISTCKKRNLFNPILDINCTSYLEHNSKIKEKKKNKTVGKLIKTEKNNKYYNFMLTDINNNFTEDYISSTLPRLGSFSTLKSDFSYHNEKNNKLLKKNEKNKIYSYINYRHNNFYEKGRNIKKWGTMDNLGKNKISNNKIGNEECLLEDEPKIKNNDKILYNLYVPVKKFDSLRGRYYKLRGNKNINL